MLKYVAIAVIVIALAILFLPSKKKKKAEGLESSESAEKKDKKERPVKQKKEKFVKEKKPKREKLSGEKRTNQKNRTKTMKEEAINSGNEQVAADALDSAMLDLGAEVQGMQDLGADYADPVNTHTTDKVTSGANKQNETIAATETAEKKGLFHKKEKANSIPESQEQPELSPIKMSDESEQIVHSNRVRKKLITEDAKEEKAEVITGISFTGDNTGGLETPDVNDLFGDASMSEENYKQMLFAAPEETPLEDNGVSGIQEIVETVPQVSMDLEPVNMQEASSNEDTQEPQAEDTAKTEEDQITTASDNAPQVSSEAAYEEVKEEEKEQTALNDACTTEATNVEENATEEPATEVESESNEKPMKELDDFVPGSVSMAKPTGLKFRERKSKEKASELLPTDFVPYSKDSQVHFILSNQNAKKPMHVDKSIEIYNLAVYKDEKSVPWDIRYEVCVRDGERVTVDTGIGVQVPVGYGIKLVPVDNLESKFGLIFASDEHVNIRDAAYSIKFDVIGAGYAAYIAKNQPLVRVKIIRI